MIEDFTDTEAYSGLTSEDDFFDVGQINPINFESMVCIKTQISLHRGCDWNMITRKLGEH